jgi:uncharacterized protein DUF4136
MRHSALVWIAVGAAAAPALAQTPKYGVTVTADKSAQFSAFKTYTWEHGWQAYDKTVHADITSAIDHELAAVGLTKQTDGPADLLVTYASLRRIDVDLKSKPTDGNAGRQQYDVGTLVVLLLEPGTRKELFRGRVDQRIEMSSPDRVKPIIDSAIAEMFAKYPTRKK